jgi:aryl sulfotransferase
MRPGKIWWLASYPKSGNTWLRAWLWALVSGKAVELEALSRFTGNGASRSQFDRALGIPSAALSYDQECNLRPRAFEVLAAETRPPAFFKVHDAYHPTPEGKALFPQAATAGAVYVVRDPRAVAVSLSHHMAEPLDRSIAFMDDHDAALARSTRLLSDYLRQRLLRWSEHVESWLGAPFAVHLVRYEDMQADPHAACAAVAAFLGLPCDPATIAAAVEATSFSRLQAQERASGFTEKPRHAAAFFREGRADGWRQVLTPQQVARIVAAHGAMMQRCNYDLSLTPRVAGRAAASRPNVAFSTGPRQSAGQRRAPRRARTTSGRAQGRRPKEE